MYWKLQQTPQSWDELSGDKSFVSLSLWPFSHVSSHVIHDLYKKILITAALNAVKISHSELKSLFAHYFLLDIPKCIAAMC